MTTDIKELMQTLKAAAGKATSGEWRRSSVLFNGITNISNPMEQGNKPHIANMSEKRDAEFIALANPISILALIEALDAKQDRITELETYSKTTLEFRGAALNENRHLKLELEIAEKRIAELQSRAEAAESRAITVTLPERYDVEVCPTPAPDGEWYHRNDILKTLDAAGIQIQGGE